VNLANAIAVLFEQLVTPERVQRALQETLRARARWTISDPFEYQDITSEKLLAYPTQDWPLDVDVVRKPKQGTGLRSERFVDLATGTLLQVIADALKERRQLAHQPGRPLAFQVGNADSYETWAKSLADWIGFELALGRAVIKVDFANFFHNIRPRQIRDAIVAAGLRDSVADAVLSIFNRINSADGERVPAERGLPVLPDEIVWIIADLILLPFDARVQNTARVTSYLRWVDDCFLSCSPEQVHEVTNAMSDLVSEFGFCLNVAKTTVMTSTYAMDQELLLHEHNLLSELFELARYSPDPESLDRFIPQIYNRLAPGKSEHARVIKRLYTLASSIGSSHLIANIKHDLQKFPAAEVQILEYMWHLKWPNEIRDILVQMILGKYTESGQLFSLQLLLRDSEVTITNDIEVACLSIINGSSTTHDIINCLAFIVVLARSPAHRQTVATLFLHNVPSYRSAMARRLAYEALYILDLSPPAGVDQNPTVTSVIEYTNSLRNGQDPTSRAATFSLQRAGSQHKVSTFSPRDY
jgi:hypothetical protein